MRPVLLALLTLLAPSAALAAAPPQREAVARPRVPDELLVDQDGREVRLYSDLLRGKVVAVNFVFTTCTTVCSPMTATFARLQRELGERLGREVFLVSLSLDPRTDTPARLRAYAERFGRRPGWTFVTGPSDRMRRALEALGGETGARDRHTPVVLLGNDATGRWTRAYGLASAQHLAEQLRSLLPPSDPRHSSR